jgi:hypothetical protein
VTTTDLAPWARIFDLCIRILFLPVLAWAVFITNTQQHHQERLAVIEATAFDAKDGRDLLDVITSNFPPLWLREDLVEIKTLLDTLDTRIRGIEQKIKDGD